MTKKKIFLILGAGVFVFLIFLLFVFFKSTQKNIPARVQTNFNRQSSTTDNSSDGQRLSNGQCQGTEKRKLGTLPMRMEDFSMILPYGIMVGDHVTPIDHQYFSPTVFNSPKDTYEVRAMADATLVGIEGPPRESYRLVFSMSCKLFYYYDLLTSLAPEIKAEYDKLPGEFSKQVNIPVYEGQLIGKIGGQTLDFAVWDMDVVLPGFIVPEHYEGEAWKVHTVDPLNYYTDELKKQVLSKYVRAIEPVSGKIDYDIDGAAAGNWFKEGSGGYIVKNQQQNSYKNHLSLSYNAIDPSGIIFSIGFFPGDVGWTIGHLRGSGLPLQFGVKGNGPDPKDISVATGLVKYELVKQELVDPSTGKLWDGKNFAQGLKIKNDERVEGVALIQIIDKRKLKVEVFPGKTADQISGFTDKAIIYER